MLSAANTNMDTPETTAEICTVCGKPTRGGFETHTSTRKDGTPVIAVDGTPDRNFNVCDLCNDVVHFRCSQWPESGYCDKCCEKMSDGDF